MSAQTSPMETDIDLGFYEPRIRALDGPVIDGFSRPRLRRADRLALGKALRERVKHKAQGEFKRAPSVDPLALIAAQDASRVGSLVPVRYARMLASPFAYLRGAAVVMAADLAGRPTTGVTVAACGDMHLTNFGIYSSAQSNLIFAINDFDEVHPGPWEWDLKRLCASACVAARSLGADEAEATRSVVAAYRKHLRRYSEMGFLETWYDRIDEASIFSSLPHKLAKRTKTLMRGAHGERHLRSFGKLTETVDGRQQFIDQPQILTRETVNKDGAPLLPAVEAMLRGYYRSLSEDRRRLFSRYRIVDVARKVVGIGSVGTDCWVMLMEGLDASDPLFLQVKEARPSVLAPYVDTPSPYSNNGKRVVAGQRLIQGAPDIFLGWGPDYGRRQYYIRQLTDMRGGVRLESDDPTAKAGLARYCALCGWALALSHAKTGDAAVITGYFGQSDSLDTALLRFARSYADQTERDHAALDQARREGTIPVDSGI